MIIVSNRRMFDDEMFCFLRMIYCLPLGDVSLDIAFIYARVLSGVLSFIIEQYQFITQHPAYADCRLYVPFLDPFFQT